MKRFDQDRYRNLGDGVHDSTPLKAVVRKRSCPGQEFESRLLGPTIYFQRLTAVWVKSKPTDLVLAQVL